MLQTRVFFGPTPKSTREYVEWFGAQVFDSVTVSVASRAFLDGGSESVIIVVYRLYKVGA